MNVALAGRMCKTPSSRSHTQISPEKGYLIYSPGIPDANALPQTARYDPPDGAVREREPMRQGHLWGQGVSAPSRGMD